MEKMAPIKSSICAPPSPFKRTFEVWWCLFTFKFGQIGHLTTRLTKNPLTLDGRERLLLFLTYLKKKTKEANFSHDGLHF